MFEDDPGTGSLRGNIIESLDRRGGTLHRQLDLAQLTFRQWHASQTIANPLELFGK